MTRMVPIETKRRNRVANNPHREGPVSGAPADSRDEGEAGSAIPGAQRSPVRDAPAPWLVSEAVPSACRARRSGPSPQAYETSSHSRPTGRPMPRSRATSGLLAQTPGRCLRRKQAARLFHTRKTFLFDEGDNTSVTEQARGRVNHICRAEHAQHVHRTTAGRARPRCPSQSFPRTLARSFPNASLHKSSASRSRFRSGRTSADRVDLPTAPPPPAALDPDGTGFRRVPPTRVDRM